MKVIYLCGDNLAKKRGYTAHIAELARHLQKLNADVSIFAPSLGRFTEWDGLKIRYAPALDIKILRPISLRFSLSIMLLRRLLARDADVVYIREFALSLAPFILGKIFKKPVILEINSAAIDGVDIKPKKALSFLKFYIRKISFILADRIIVANQPARDLLSKNYDIMPDKFEVIPMGANVDLFRPMDKYLCRKRVNLGADYKYVGFIGTLYPFQGLEYLIKAAPSILKTMKDVRFLIVGSGADEKKLKELAAGNGLTENFIFAGEKNYVTIPYYVNSLDLCVSFVTPERGETFSFPIKIYEYLACERPVIIGNLKAVNELVGTKATPLVDAADSNILAKAIIDTLEGLDALREESKRLRALVAEKFSWEKTAKKTLELFGSVTHD